MSKEYGENQEYFERGDHFTDEGNYSKAIENYTKSLSNDSLSAIQKEGLNRKIQKLNDLSHINTKTVESRASLAILAIGSFIVALFFFSVNITGNAIGNLAYNTSNWIGLILFVLGLVLAFFYFKKRNT
ncbi:hypothetical protein CMI40_00245 [Candidatus Pacearchaeota archaeon]|jgi:hypothetical protein|nr:hypothetical protein [Candidatus Pacearchaeota archaeon]|tara:strand:- start:4939 stop:5325 length:387 start_codon:yes stop_codon:yes gene_type:complete